MSLKVKLVSCLSAFIIVASLMLISVFAATNVTLNIGGTVSFTANSVNALITGSIAGNATGGSTLTTIDIDASDSDGAVSMPSDWTNMDLTFTESASPITVTINIQNRSTDRAIAVSLTDSTSISNVTVTRECDSASINATDNRNIPAGETITYTFELSVQSQDSSASGAFSLAVGLENAGEVEGYNFTLILTNENTITTPEFYFKIDDEIIDNSIFDTSGTDTKQFTGYNLYISTRTFVDTNTLNISSSSDKMDDAQVYAGDRGTSVIYKNDVEVASYLTDFSIYEGSDVSSIDTNTICISLTEGCTIKIIY